MLRWTEQAAGGVVILSVLIDVFLTVLYARISPGIFSRPLARLMWRSFLAIDTLFGEETGANSYSALRTSWAGSIEKLAPTMSYSMAEIDPAANP